MTIIVRMIPQSTSKFKICMGGCLSRGVFEIVGHFHAWLHVAKQKVFGFNIRLSDIILYLGVFVLAVHFESRNFTKLYTLSFLRLNLRRVKHVFFFYTG